MPANPTHTPLTAPTRAPLVGPDYDGLEVRDASLGAAADGAPVLVYELSSRRGADEPPERFFKAVRLGEPQRGVTPLYATAAECQRDILGALRELGHLFISVVGTVDGRALRLWGVQAVADTREAALVEVEVAWERLAAQYRGALNAELTPLSLDQVPLLAAARAWAPLSMVRGRPVLADPTDSNEDVSSLERFVDAPGDFLFTLVAVPFSPTAIARTWRQRVASLSEQRELLDAGGPGQFVAARRLLVKILEESAEHLRAALEGGAFLCQGFLAAPSAVDLDLAETYVRGAFAPTSTATTQPLHVVSDLGEDAERLRRHAAVFSSDRRPETSAVLVEPFTYSTMLTLDEVATLSHPPSAPAPELAQ